MMTHDERVMRWVGRVAVDEGGCWIWPGAKFRSGYGNVSVVELDGSRRNAGLHRVLYEHFVGPIPEGLDLDHLCRTPACCNPEHLEPVTRSVNLKRGVGVGGIRVPPKTHCVRGHAFDEENTRVTKDGRHRQCRACDRERQRRYAAAKGFCREEMAVCGDQSVAA